MSDADRQAKLEQFRKEVEGLDNVVGVAFDPKAGEFVALVTEKKAEDDIPENQLVANNTSLARDEHGVVEVGHIKAHVLKMAAADDEGTTEAETFEPESSAVFRPVEAGAEEQPDGRPWVGTGSFIARVTDPSKGNWADDVAEDTVVRVSNWHVYVGGEFEAHRPIRQPFGGDVVGELVGEVPLEDGVTVDVAARTVSEHDGWGTVELETADSGEEYGRGIVADVTDDHVGQTVTKSGRTTDVTSAEISLVDVSVNVDYGEEDEPDFVRIDDCVLTTDLGDSGDSGSAVFLKETGELCGLYFAGSDTTGVFSQIGNIEASFGAEPITDWDPEVPPASHGPGGEAEDDLERFKDDLIAYIEEWSP